MQWKYEDIENEDILMKKFYDFINNPDYTEVNIIKGQENQIKHITTTKVIKDTSIKFVDLQKQYPHSTIEGVVFDGKIQYYKVVEKLQ